LLQTLAGLTVCNTSILHRSCILANLIKGTTITLTTKFTKRYEGVIASIAGERNTAGLTLRDVKELSAPGAPLKDQLFVPAPDIDTWTSGPADAKVPNGDCMCPLTFIYSLIH